VNPVEVENAAQIEVEEIGFALRMGLGHAFEARLVRSVGLGAVPYSGSSQDLGGSKQANYFVGRCLAGKIEVYVREYGAVLLHLGCVRSPPLEGLP